MEGTLRCGGVPEPIIDTRQLRTQHVGQDESLEVQVAAFRFNELRYGMDLLWFIDNAAASFRPDPRRLCGGGQRPRGIRGDVAPGSTALSNLV